MQAQFGRDEVATLDAPAPVFDPRENGFFDDPYIQYNRLRDLDPVHRTAAGLVMCFAHDDVRRVLVDSATSMDSRKVAELGTSGSHTAARRLFPHGVINLDAPDHTRLRQLMSKSFTPRKIAVLGTWIQAEVDCLLDDVERRWTETGEPVDLIGDFAFPLPFKVISDILGMPDGDQRQVRDWAQDVSAATDPTAGRARVAGAHAAYAAISEYVANEVLPWKRGHLADDLLSALVIARDDGKLSEPELLDQVTLLYVAGHETTVGLIGNSILTLLRHRTQMDKLIGEPDLMAGAVEELNRYESAIQFGWRYTLNELTVRDETVGPGQMVLLCIGSANRDAGYFGPTAGELDLTRSNAAAALSFGAGIHFCLGSALARREATLALGSLLERFPRMELAGPPVWNRRITFRSLDSLTVALSS